MLDFHNGAKIILPESAHDHYDVIYAALHKLLHSNSGIVLTQGASCRIMEEELEVRL